jgi:hypothetical protein
MEGGDGLSVKRLTSANRFRGLGSICPMLTQSGNLVNIASNPAEISREGLLNHIVANLAHYIQKSWASY